jgi:hypothetical protein
MKESYRKGLANHPDPESWMIRREADRQALTGAHAGRVLSCDIKHHRGADGVHMSEGDTARGATASLVLALRSRRPRACMETPRARTGRPHERPLRKVGSGPGGQGHAP